MPTMSLPFSAQNAIEPLQLDSQEDNDNEDQNLHVENPTLDLENYASAYTGLPKLYRLIFIADVCPTYHIEALKMAINHVITTYNVNMYQLLFKKLNDALLSERNGHAAVSTTSCMSLPDIASQSNAMPANPTFGISFNLNPAPMATSSAGNIINNSHDLPVYDSNWVEAKSKSAALKLEKLDSDLKNYKSNSIKESIRRGQDDLGDHYLNCGDLSNALKCYSRSRDYCTSGKHVVNMCLNVIKVSLYLQNWSHVLSYVSKAESTPDFSEGKEISMIISTRLKCAAGIAELQMRNFKGAAKQFIQCSLDHCENPELLSPNNVAIYGGLCALASFDRGEMQRLVISSSSFKLFLELEPQLRDIIFRFYESNYSSGLVLLNELRDNLLLDMYIAPHLNIIYKRIRNRALVQYFSPYILADMHKMATSFNVTIEHLENEIMFLILDGQIQARIDSHSKILYRKEPDLRSATFAHALEMGRDYHRRARMLLVRAAMQKSNIIIKSSETTTGPGSSLTSLSTNNARN